MIHVTGAQQFALHEQARRDGDNLGPESADDLRTLLEIDPTLIPKPFVKGEIYSITVDDTNLLIDTRRAK